MCVEFRLAGSVMTEPQENLDLWTLFTAMSEIYVWNCFIENVLRYVARNLSQAEPVYARYFDLPKNAEEANIERKISRCRFGFVDGLVLIVWLVFRQLHGEEGELCTEYSNRFLLQVNRKRLLLVRVYWSSSNGQWRVLGTPFNRRNEEIAGTRVFFPLRASA